MEDKRTEEISADDLIAAYQQFNSWTLVLDRSRFVDDLRAIVSAGTTEEAAAAMKTPVVFAGKSSILRLIHACELRRKFGIEMEEDVATAFTIYWALKRKNVDSDIEFVLGTIRAVRQMAAEGTVIDPSSVKF